MIEEDLQESVGIEEYKGNLQVELWRDPLIKSTG